MISIKNTKLHVPQKYIYLSALLLCVIVILQTSRNGVEGSFIIELRHVIFYVINYLLWAVLINWVYGITKLLDSFIKQPSVKRSTAIVVNLIFILVVHLLISNVLYAAFSFFTIETFTLTQFIDSFNEALLSSIFRRLIDVIIIIILLRIIDTFQTVQKKNLQLAELENLLHVSELQSLKAQLQPHFLFNALHALHTLIGHDDAKAKSMVIKMSHLLRKMLDQRDKQEISFEEELNYLKDYLEIEEERFHDRLSIHYDIEEATKKIMVPVLMLQPLAENAFKHGISLIEGKSIIRVSAKLDTDSLIIEMSNTIPTDNQSTAMQSTKFGLKNLEERLLQLYGDSYIFKTEKAAGMFTVKIAIKTNLNV